MFYFVIFKHKGSVVNYYQHFSLLLINLCFFSFNVLDLDEDELDILDSRILSSTTIGRKCARDAVESCPSTPYRSLSGHCNNVQFPLFGVALEPMQRLAHNAYYDGSHAGFCLRHFYRIKLRH